MTKKPIKPIYLISVLFLVIIIDTMGVSLAWPVFGSLFTSDSSPLFTSTIPLQWRNILYGITVGLSSLFTFLGAPLIGDLSDRIGRRKVLISCLLGTTIGMGVSILGVIWHQVWLLMLSRAWLGAIAASQILAQATIVDISNRENKAALLGVISVANNMGFLIGPIIGGLLIDNSLISWFGFTTPFFFAASFALLNATLLAITYRETYTPAPTAPKRKLTTGLQVFMRALKYKKIRPLSFIYVCFQVGWALFLNSTFLYLIQNYNYSGRLLSSFSLWMGVIFCFSLLVLVRFISRLITLKKTIYLSLFTATMCCVAAIHSNETGLWLSFIPMVAAISIGGNAMVTTFSNISTTAEQGWIMGVCTALASICWAITPAFAGFLVTFGFYLPLSAAGILFTLATIVCGYKLKNQ